MPGGDQASEIGLDAGRPARGAGIGRFCSPGYGPPEKPPTRPRVTAVPGVREKDRSRVKPNGPRAAPRLRAFGQGGHFLPGRDEALAFDNVGTGRAVPALALDAPADLHSDLPPSSARGQLFNIGARPSLATLNPSWAVLALQGRYPGHKPPPSSGRLTPLRRLMRDGLPESA
jgi:hypothetical protein